MVFIFGFFNIKNSFLSSSVHHATCICNGALWLRHRRLPLACPLCGVFARMPPGLSSSKRDRCYFWRALHVVVMVPDYWWSESCSFPLEHLERATSASHLRNLRRLTGLMLADGPTEPFRFCAVADVFTNW